MAVAKEKHNRAVTASSIKDNSSTTSIVPILKGK